MMHCHGCLEPFGKMYIDGNTTNLEDEYLINPKKVYYDGKEGEPRTKLVDSVNGGGVRKRYYEGEAISHITYDD